MLPDIVACEASAELSPSWSSFVSASGCAHGSLKSV
jgi:hypothetical protein